MTSGAEQFHFIDGPLIPHSTANRQIDAAYAAGREAALAEVDGACRLLGEFDVFASRAGFSLRLQHHQLVDECGDDIDPEGTTLLSALQYATTALNADAASLTDQEGPK